MTLFNINWYMYIVIFTIKKTKKERFCTFYMYYFFVLNNFTDPGVPYYPREVNFEGLYGGIISHSHVRMV